MPGTAHEARIAGASSASSSTTVQRRAISNTLIFTATVHSPIGRDPARYGITLLPRPAPVFAENDVPFTDPVGTDHDALGPALHRAVYGYMHGVGLDWDVRRFFPRGTPASTVPADLVTSAIGDRE